MTLELSRLTSRTIWQAVSDAARQWPDRNALVAADDAGEIRRLTYRNLVGRAINLSAGLASLGVKRGDRVVLWMTNRLEWVVAAFAVMRLGATLVPINTFLKPPEIKYLIEQSGARHLIMLEAFRALRMPQMLAEICAGFETAAVPGHLSSPELPDLRNVVILQQGGKRPGAFDFEALEVSGTQGEARALADRMEAAATPQDLAMIKYTSGSTSFPKGVMLEQGGIVANAVLHSRRTGITSSDIFFSMMPFFHGGGSIWGLMTMMVNGGTLVFTEAFDAALAAQLIAGERPTVMFGVLGVEVVQVALDRGLSFPSLRVAHVPHEEARSIMPNVSFCITPFGLTETYGPAAVSSPLDPPDKIGTSGRMLDGNECRVVDPVTQTDVKPGTPGEAWVRGLVMRGYWNKPEETARALTEDGWLRSEDIISMDADGYITYAGRLKLMLKVGGENVSIEEVEAAISGHPSVAACGVVGVPDQRKGEVVRAYVSCRTNHPLEPAQLQLWLQSRLARFKWPREIIMVDQLPRLANGKLDRLSLNRRAQE